MRTLRVWRYVVPRGAVWTFLYGELPGLERRRFVAVARRLGADGELHETRRARFARRWIAKDRAYLWFCQRSKIVFRTLHRAPRLSKAERAKRARNFRQARP